MGEAQKIADAKATKKKNKGGRPVKLSKEWVLMADKLFQGEEVELSFVDKDGNECFYTKKVNEFRAIFLSDEELVTYVNEKLIDIDEGDKTFDYRTFQRYKARFVKDDDGKKETEKEASEPINKKDEDNFMLFCRLIKKHLIEQKAKLFQGLVDAKDWQKYAWIIERKFDEWKMKSAYTHEHTGKDGKPLYDEVKITIVKPEEKNTDK